MVGWSCFLCLFFKENCLIKFLRSDSNKKSDNSGTKEKVRLMGKHLIIKEFSSRLNFNDLLQIILQFSYSDLIKTIN